MYFQYIPLIYELYIGILASLLLLDSDFLIGIFPITTFWKSHFFSKLKMAKTFALPIR